MKTKKLAGFISATTLAVTAALLGSAAPAQAIPFGCSSTQTSIGSAYSSCTGGTGYHQVVVTYRPTGGTGFLNAYGPTASPFGTSSVTVSGTIISHSVSKWD
ncbi:hypothetical protein [Sinosporangium siamense]|uniref:Uncharacterized protein n=1 Tax=Sinosporangium siamense TaxID=1367973 RepID=A0A919RIR6_9ACTN|nr:hypothetical protein [Sinosporangium siamense]GII94047.1 hypothetical protein Ssi02_42780 [Sinosporangium siamense]